jgi:hypothetical protein
MTSSSSKARLPVSLSASSSCQQNTSVDVIPENHEACRFDCGRVEHKNLMRDTSGGGRKIPAYACVPCASAHQCLTGARKKTDHNVLVAIREIRDTNWLLYCAKVRAFRVTDVKGEPGMHTSQGRRDAISLWQSHIAVNLKVEEGRKYQCLTKKEMDGGSGRDEDGPY